MPEDRYATVIDLAVFTHRQLEARRRVSPGVETLAMIFRMMYAASMASEEGQQVTFELNWMDPDDPDPDPPERIVANRWMVIPLTSRIPLVTRNLVKAAKATDQRTSSFAVFGHGSNSIFIWGMIDQGNQRYDFMRFDSDSAHARPGVFQASVTGVGHLAVSVEYGPIAELRVDRLYGESLDPLRSGAIYELLRPTIEDHVRSVKASVSAEIYEDRDHWDVTLQSDWINTLAKILLRIQGMGHDGALLLNEAASSGLDIKYEIAYSRMPDALRRAGVARIMATHADDLIMDATEGDADSIEADVYLDRVVNLAESEDTKDEVNGIVWFIACLSRVDGLVVMSRDFSVRGFGAMITVEEKPDAIHEAYNEMGYPQDAKQLSYDAFGTRHRSMMRYCSRYPGSIGFVISHDGDVRAMTKLGDVLVVWQSVRLQRALRISNDVD